MSEDLTIQGSLAETTVPDLFRTIIRSRENAVVSVAGDFRQDSFYFRDGHLAFASSTSADLGLADVLLVSGELSLNQYRDVTERAGTARRVSDVIIEAGVMKREDLARAIELQITRIVDEAITLASGEYTIEFLTDFPSEVTAVSIDSDKMILAAIGHVARWSVVERGIGSVDRVVRQVSGADARAFALELTDAESHVLGIVSEPLSIAAVCERSYLPNFVVCRTVWALLVAGLVEDVRESTDDADDERREMISTEYELEGEVERYNTASQELFSVVFQKIGDYSFDFVDRIVSRLSPQNLALLSGMSMVNEGRVDVDQLLTNLATSAPREKRRIVGDLMNELLQGWILEIRTEFGDQLDSAIATAQGKIRTQ